MKSTTKGLRDLFPKKKPYRSGDLKVSKLHTIHFEEYGNPRGKPLVFLHGGPGGGIEPSYHRYFDPKKWRIVLHDQRGCGKSTPFSELRENTTWHLVADIEKLREHLGIDRWVVFGGSWGSTLSLAYAWEHYLAPIPSRERSDMMKAYYRRLTSPDRSVRQKAARAWSIWEGSTSKLFFDPALVKKFGGGRFADAFARIEAHYFVNRGFMKPDDQLLRDVRKVRRVPGVIVQGRYDVVCPIRSAWDLHRAWPEAKLVIVPNAGHSMTEPGIRSALIEETERFARL